MADFNLTDYELSVAGVPLVFLSGVTESDHAEADKFMPPIKPRGNLKDPVKIQEDVAEKRERWLLESARSPITGRVVHAKIVSEAGGILTVNSGPALIRGLEEVARRAGSTLNSQDELRRALLFGGMSRDPEVLFVIVGHDAKLLLRVAAFEHYQQTGSLPSAGWWVHGSPIRVIDQPTEFFSLYGLDPLMLGRWFGAKLDDAVRAEPLQEAIRLSDNMLWSTIAMTAALLDMRKKS